MPKSKVLSVSGSRPTVHLESLDEGIIAVLTLDDSKGTNVMGPEMGDVFSRHIAVIQEDAAVRAVIIRGAGKDFSIGGHRDMLIGLGKAGRSEKELHDFMLAFYNRWLPVLDLPVPVIAVLQGNCIGVAPLFACAADIAFADETLRLQVTFAGLGLYPGMAMPTLLTRKVGPYRATLLTMANEVITGGEAERIGLVERCVPAGAAYEEALKTARAIGASAPSVVRLLKKNLGIKKTDLTSELEMNAGQQARDFQTDEYRSRVANYLPDHYA
jgi:2-(1,2-epoxy-1,2-dihydrophenyl)acetyl-CoA isomerase